MALAAAQVVDAIAARLVPMVATGGRVYTSRAWPLAESELPAWRVTAEDESATPDIVSDGTNRHDLTLNATAYARATADLDDALHALAATGLALLFAPAVPYGLQLQRISRRMGDDGEDALGAITLQLSCIYWVNPASPETIYS
jgi:hypothetical protein